MLDGLDMDHLIDMYGFDHFTIPAQGLKPEKHTLAVVPAARPAGTPSVSIVAPHNGAAVGRRFDVQVAVNDFAPSCSVEGKPDVAGYGYIQIFATQSGETSAKPAAPLPAIMNTPKGMEMGT
ncbi:MAG TPA: hypothetical protein VNJ51_06525 [Candidatus Dormibacteraeota bacterium]|nr:hypothetical protein [Candidatus Dormibacteraeota bacterium]